MNKEDERYIKFSSIHFPKKWDKDTCSNMTKERAMNILKGFKDVGDIFDKLHPAVVEETVEVKKDVD